MSADPTLRVKWELWVDFERNGREFYESGTHKFKGGYNLDKITGEIERLNRISGANMDQYVTLKIKITQDDESFLRLRDVLL